MLQVSHLTKKYGRITANDDVTFGVQAGEVAVLLGPNGAGKSTAVKCIAGLLRFSGTILVNGHPNKTVQAKAALGYVPETPALYDMLTVMEHMEFIARAYRVDNWQATAEALLARFDMLDKADKLAKELSKGMQQKVSLCCALLPAPRVALFDEPLVGLDPHAIKELKTLFGELRARGCAVLISTHMLDSVADIWDQTLIMCDGRIAAMRRRTQESSQGETLEQLFFRITEGGR